MTEDVFTEPTESTEDWTDDVGEERGRAILQRVARRQDIDLDAADSES